MLLPRRILGLLLLGKVGFFVAAIDELEAVVVAIDEFVVVSNDELVAVVVAIDEFVFVTNDELVAVVDARSISVMEP